MQIQFVLTRYNDTILVDQVTDIVPKVGDLIYYGTDYKVIKVRWVPKVDSINLAIQVEAVALDHFRESTGNRPTWN